MGQCITISGPHGAGTSSAGKMLAEKLGIRFVSAGEYFRAEARRLSIPIGEFNQVMQQSQEMREELDDKLREMAKQGNIVVEGRIAAWTANQVADLKVCITASPDVRIRRIAIRDDISIEEAEEETSQRDNQERETFQKLYGIDIDDLSIYDVTINSDKLSTEQVVEVIHERLVTNSE